MEKLGLDLYRCQKSGLENEKQIYSICEKVASDLGLNLFIKPVIIPYFYGKVKMDDGISCITYFVSNGNLSFFTIHTFSKRKVVYFDIVSEQTLNKTLIKQVLKDNFESLEITEGFEFNGTKTWGIELTSSVKVSTPPRMSFDKLYDLTEEIIKTIKMTKISNTIIEKNQNSMILTALIAESHIAFMYDLKNNILKTDIFSCKYFDAKIVCELIKKFCGSDLKYDVISRGLKHEILADNN